MDSSDAVGMKKGPWTANEDSILMDYVRKHGEGNWNAVQKKTPLLRCGKSCRLRWANHLRPNLKKGAFSPEEEFLILRLHAQLGNKWARMAALLPGRTDNEIKNYWNTRIKRWKRTGLPLYPPEILRQVAAIRHRGYSSSATANKLDPSDPASTNLLLYSHHSLTGNPILELPRIKTFRDDYQPPIYQHNLFHVPPTSEPSSGLLDELLLQRGKKDPSLPETAAGKNCISLADKRSLDSFSNSDRSDGSKGMKKKTDLQQQNNLMNDDMEIQPETANPDLEDKNSFIPFMEMQQETANPNLEDKNSFIPFAPLDRNWHMRSLSWNTMPEIC